MASNYVTQKQLLAHMNIIMKHAPIYYMQAQCFAHVLLYIVNFEIAWLHDYTLEQIDFWCFLIVICDKLGYVLIQVYYKK